MAQSEVDRVIQESGLLGQAAPAPATGPGQPSPRVERPAGPVDRWGRRDSPGVEVARPALAGAPSEGGLDITPPDTLPGVAQERPPVDPNKEREDLYRVAFSEVEDDWEEHLRKTRRTRFLSSVEVGVFQASLVTMVIELIIYLVSAGAYFGGAVGVELFVSRAEAFTAAFLLLGIVFLLAVFALFSSALFGPDRPDYFWKIQGLAFLVFAPPFFMVVLNARLDVWIGLIFVLIAIGFFAWTFQRRLMPSGKEAPFFLSLWIAGVWIFLMVQLGVILRELLISVLTPLWFGYGQYLHFGVYDFYLLILATVFCVLGYVNLRPTYLARESFDDSLALGIDAYVVGSYDGALAYFNRAIRTGEEILRRKWRLLDLDLAWMGRGACELRMRRADDALSSLKMSTKLNPANSVAWNMLGICLMERREYEKSGDAFRRAIDINPKYAEAYNNIGNIFYLLKRYEDALKYYQAALDTDKKYRDAWMNMGYTYLALGRHKDAIKCSNEAMRLGAAAI
jgi:superkiller protein 3